MSKKYHVEHPLRLIAAVAVGAAAVMGVLIWGVNTRTELDANSISFESKSAMTTIALHPGSPQVKVGDTIMLSADMNAAEDVKLVDVVITYDPSVVKLSMVNLKGKDLLSRYIQTDSSLFTTFSKFSMDQSKGRISFSAAVAANSSAKGPGRIGTMAFKAVKTGASPVSIEYIAGKVNETNVFSVKGTDVLQSVSGSTITVK